MQPMGKMRGGDEARSKFSLMIKEICVIDDYLGNGEVDSSILSGSTIFFGSAPCDSKSIRRKFPYA